MISNTKIKSGKRVQLFFVCVALANQVNLSLFLFLLKIVPKRRKHCLFFWIPIHNLICSFVHIYIFGNNLGFLLVLSFQNGLVAIYFWKYFHFIPANDFVLNLPPTIDKTNVFCYLIGPNVHMDKMECEKETINFATNANGRFINEKARKKNCTEKEWLQHQRLHRRPQKKFLVKSPIHIEKFKWRKIITFFLLQSACIDYCVSLLLSRFFSLVVVVGCKMNLYAWIKCIRTLLELSSECIRKCMIALY